MAVGRPRRRRVDLLVIGVLAVLVALVIIVAVTGSKGDDEPARPSTTSTGSSSTVEDVDPSISLGVEPMADGRVRFHVPACATEGATTLFWNVVLRDPSADLEVWQAAADEPRRLRSMIGGAPLQGFDTVDPLGATRPEMRDDVESIAGVLRNGSLPTVGIRFRLGDLREGRIAYRQPQTGPLRFAASTDELDAAVSCDG